MSITEFEGRILDKLGDECRQEIQCVLSNKEIIFFTFTFVEEINSWWMDLKYKEVEINSIKLVYSFDLLRQYTNILPFNIVILSTTGIDPITQDAFKNGLNTFVVVENEEI